MPFAYFALGLPTAEAKVSNQFRHKEGLITPTMSLNVLWDGNIWLIKTIISRTQNIWNLKILLNLDLYFMVQSMKKLKFICNTKPNLQLAEW